MIHMIFDGFLLHKKNGSKVCIFFFPDNKYKSESMTKKLIEFDFSKKLNKKKGWEQSLYIIDSL